MGTLVTFYIVFINALHHDISHDQSAMTINRLTYTREELLGHNTRAPVSVQLLRTIRDNEICSAPRTHPGVTAGKCKQRSIHCVLTQREDVPQN